MNSPEEMQELMDLATSVLKSKHPSQESLTELKNLTQKFQSTLDRDNLSYAVCDSITAHIDLLGNDMELLVTDSDEWKTLNDVALNMLISGSILARVNPLETSKLVDSVDDIIKYCYLQGYQRGVSDSSSSIFRT